MSLFKSCSEFKNLSKSMQKKKVLKFVKNAVEITQELLILLENRFLKSCSEYKKVK